MRKSSYLTYILIIGDILILYAALAAALMLRYGTAEFSRQWDAHAFPFGVVFILWIAVFSIGGLYERKFLKSGADLQNLIFQNIIASGLIAAVIFYTIPFFGITPKTNLFIHLLITAILIYAWRSWAVYFMSRIFKIKTIFFGTSREIIELAEHLITNPQFGYKTVCIVSTEETEIKINNIPVVRFNGDLPEIIDQFDAQLLVASSEIKKDESVIRMLYKILPSGISFADFPSFYEHITGKVPVSLISEMWFIENLAQLKSSARDVIKRTSDIILSLISGSVTLIILPIIALAIKMESRGPVFIRQTRMGKNGKLFTLYKFRSMIALDGKGMAENGSPEWAGVKDKRITRIGNFLRRTHIDELPQSWNILKGELSIVGPRPERPEFVEKLEKQLPHYTMRHLIKPGVTGWAQINQVYAGSVEETLEKLQYDLYYIKHRSFFIDMFIILKTALTTIKLSGR
ncbi:MAG: hypothetical protein COU46_01885 [Candidatus Niyogibacteria bacterium CG10_big_fil_rev_8_21_14_0_10_42_19]|uniref:Bacterial sugar transferase domain-containing protein n=1 Tax=Candidatus Niyogibacteria bacterium CG10_big_fil_rev_8_21_14_0_10_42_19 TaxID=1974725 RepID=A0A2H0TFM9_9BACT|nr:MAG: hypothetical protein COU46_01885 [Candidatus Niyogibacteria bacterium CG10_big_fil_rev_8_21_14_0_10_42_19]